MSGTVAVATWLGDGAETAVEDGVGVGFAPHATMNNVTSTIGTLKYFIRILFPLLKQPITGPTLG
jgi:hypothetical protein